MNRRPTIVGEGTLPTATVLPVRLGEVRGLLIELPLEQSELPDCLTEVEREVSLLVLEGMSNQEIASARGSRYRTVANQLASIYAKLGVNSRGELVALLTGGGVT